MFYFIIGLFAIITFQKSAVYAEGDDNERNGLAQTYSVELNIEQGEKTLRALAVWAEPISSLFEPDSPAILNYAVNKSVKDTC